MTPLTPRDYIAIEDIPVKFIGVWAPHMFNWKQRILHRLFMKYVYPAWLKGHERHRRLVQQGYIAHMEEPELCSCIPFKEREKQHE